MSVWFTSDLHLGHKNLCEGIRGIDPDLNYAEILRNFNRLVRKRDKLIILGDLSMEKSGIVIKFLSSLNCSNITIVGGNHDTEKSVYEIIQATFDGPLRNKKLRIVGGMSYKGYLVTHIPVHTHCLWGFKGNIHGHIHQAPVDKIKLGFNYNPRELEDKRYLNVNVEYNFYEPWSFKEIEDYFNQ